MQHSHEPKPSQDPSTADRRTFLSTASSVVMAGGLLAGYGTFAGFAARYLYPAKPTPKGWMFVATTTSLKPGESLAYKTPAGAAVAIARQGAGETAADFIALSSTCPHLGCQVHWESKDSRFFCPCHNGAFDGNGVAIGGPPKEAGQSLPRYPLKVEHGLLFIEVPTGREIASADRPAREAPCRPRRDIQAFDGPLGDTTEMRV